MIYRSLGKTGLRVSSLGFGGSSLGGAFGPVDEGEAIRAVHAAIDSGINIFDTAPYYGATRAESVLGKALAQTARDRVVISTKVGRYGPRPEDFDFSADRVTRSVDESRQRLGVDYIDIIQVHDIEFGDVRQILEETIPALERIRKLGRVRYIGVSGFPLPLLLRAAVESGVDVVQSYCHASLINTELTCIVPKLTEIGAGIFSSAPLAMRLLTDVGPPDWHPASSHLRARCAQAAGYCRDHGCSISDVALYYSHHISGPHCTLLGISNCAELSRALAAIQTPPAPELLENVLRILEPVRNTGWVSGRPENQS